MNEKKGRAPVSASAPKTNAIKRVCTDNIIHHFYGNVNTKKEENCQKAKKFCELTVGGFQIMKAVKLKILVACEESQAVCKEMRKLGHEAYSADIQEPSGGHPEWHILGDVLPLINGHCKFATMDGTSHEISGKWDMIIAFPPCTYLSNAGACRLYPKKGVLNQERYKRGLEAKDFFMKFINADCDKIAVENPVHSKIFQTPLHSQEIQPYQFGHPYSKKTRLWLKALSPLVPTKIIKEHTPFLPSGTSRKDKTKYGAKQCAHNGFDRSKTFPGIAKAMAEQWAGSANLPEMCGRKFESMEELREAM